MIDEKKLIKEIKNHRDFWFSEAGKYDEMSDEMNTDICDGKAVELEVVMRMIQDQPKVSEWIPCSERLPISKPWEEENENRKWLVDRRV